MRVILLDWIFGNKEGSSYNKHYVWGRPDSETDGNGNTTVYEKDRWGHVTKVTLPDGGIEKYHYDACGRLRELITGEQKTSYGYDKAGRLAEVCSSNGIRAQYRYDRNGMQTEVLYGNGLRTSYTYDERSQLTEHRQSGCIMRTTFITVMYP